MALLNCPECKKEISSLAHACPYCGVPIADLHEGLSKQSVQILKCPMCGANIRQNERECSYCGSTLIVISVEKIFSQKVDPQVLVSSVSKWRDILKKEPDNAEAHYALGLAYLNQGLREAALQHLQKASLLAPESPIVQYNLALALFNDGMVVIESDAYRNVVKAIDYASLLDPSFREAEAFKHYFMAQKLENIDLAQSITEYEATIKACPGIPVFYNNLGVVYFKLKKYQLAEKCYLQAIGIAPKFGLVYSNLCHLCYETHKYQDGIKYGRKAVEFINPNPFLPVYEANAYNNLSLCLWKMGQKQEAINAIQKAMAILPKEPLYNANLQEYQKFKLF